MLGVPENGEEFDYGFKLKDDKVSKHRTNFSVFKSKIVYIFGPLVFSILLAHTAYYLQIPNGKLFFLYTSNVLNYFFLVYIYS